MNPPNVQKDRKWSEKCTFKLDVGRKLRFATLNEYVGTWSVGSDPDAASAINLFSAVRAVHHISHSE